jgi:hypothetical protein
MYLSEVGCEELSGIQAAVDCVIAGCCEHGNEHQGSIMCFEFLKYQLLKVSAT